MASFPNRRALLGLSIALLSAAGAARAAEAEAETARPALDLAIEEVVVTARQYNAAAQLTDERIVDDAVSDFSARKRLAESAIPTWPWPCSGFPASP
jgi:hypothetical protein